MGDTDNHYGSAESDVASDRKLNPNRRKLKPEDRQTQRHRGQAGQGPAWTERQRIEEGAYTGVYAPSPLKDQLQRKLDHAIVAGLQAVVAADIAGDLPEVWRIERNATANIAHTSCTRSGEIHVVGKVEGFRADLDRLAFANRKGPRHGHIELNGMRP